MALIVPTSAIAGLEAVIDGLTPTERARIDQAALAAEGPAIAAARHWNFDLPSTTADAALAEPALAESAGPALDRLRRGLAARWALTLPRRVQALNLPEPIMALYPAAVSRLADFLTPSDQPYDKDYWAKDVRFVLGLTVPAGAQVVDLHARIGPGEIARHVRDGRGLGAASAYVAAQGWGPWLQIHTEARDTAAFNEAGWDACYVRIAALLKRLPAARGVMGASWFYDPPLREISPRLAYLQDRPMTNGAFLVHQGTSPLYTERATQTSPTRRKLVEDGAYTPRSWILAWPRAALIRWAGDQA